MMLGDTSLSTPSGGLIHFDLVTVFRCAVELGEAVADLEPKDWENVTPFADSPYSPEGMQAAERSRRVSRIEEETQRLKRALGAIGPLEFNDDPASTEASWPHFRDKFANCAHDRSVRLALHKLATAAVDLSGFATWRDWQWHMREQGISLLRWGLGQLWEGLTSDERKLLQGCLTRANKAVGWPNNPSKVTPYDGPNGIPLELQHRTCVNHITCYPGYLQDRLNNEVAQREAAQNKAMRIATVIQFTELAEESAKLLRELATRSFDSVHECGGLYTNALGRLDCLRRAKEVSPRAGWAPGAIECRVSIADAALKVLPGLAEILRTGSFSDPTREAISEFQNAVHRLRAETLREASLSPLKLAESIAEARWHLARVREEVTRVIATKPESFKALIVDFHLPAVWGKLDVLRAEFQFGGPVEAVPVPPAEPWSPEAVFALLEQASNWLTRESRNFDVGSDVLLRKDESWNERVADFWEWVEGVKRRSLSPVQALESLIDLAIVLRDLLADALPLDAKLPLLNEPMPNAPAFFRQTRVENVARQLREVGILDLLRTVVFGAIKSDPRSDMRGQLRTLCHSVEAYAASPTQDIEAALNSAIIQARDELLLMLSPPEQASPSLDAINGHARKVDSRPIDALAAQGTVETGRTGEEQAKARKKKRSHGAGDARVKLISALTKHHQYSTGSCLNTAPIGNNDLARLAEVANSSASKFFDEKFGGYEKYSALCHRGAELLVVSLKLLNGEYVPEHFVGNRRHSEESQHHRASDDD